MEFPDCAYMTFYYNDGTKETVQTYTYSMALSKLTKKDPFSFAPIWQMGRGEGENELVWTEKGEWLSIQEAKQNVVV